MESIRQQISQWLDVESSNLNEIALEDVRFMPFVQNNIGTAVVQMLSLDRGTAKAAGLSTYQTDGIPLKGFWVEHTKELVVYLKISNQLKAIVVPHEGWGVREDITLN